MVTLGMVHARHGLQDKLAHKTSIKLLNKNADEGGLAKIHVTHETLQLRATRLLE